MLNPSLVELILCDAENFPQAVSDYTSSLSIKMKLLPSSSRELASVHYRLATVLEFTPQRRGDSLKHVQSALSAFKERKSQLQAAISSPSDTNISIEEDVKKMSTKQRADELSDVQGLIGDLESKIEELKSAPAMGGDLVTQGIEHLLGGGSGAFGEGSGGAQEDDKPVNDLTSMVKKKAPKKVKPAAAGAENGTLNGSGGKSNGENPTDGNGESNGEKRKAQDPVDIGESDKRAKMD
jgi:HAT1-interacting factor 1